MATGRIVLLSGAPGTGKSTAAALLARNSQLEASLTLRTDSFYEALGKGAVPPHLPGSETQNQVVIEAFLAAAVRFAQGGYDVIVDGVVGPWYLEPWLAAARKGTEIHYFVLRADRETTLARALGRAKLDEATNRQLMETMWEQFARLGPWEPYALDTTCLSPGRPPPCSRRNCGWAYTGWGLGDGAETGASLRLFSFLRHKLPCGNTDRAEKSPEAAPRGMLLLIGYFFPAARFGGPFHGVADTLHPIAFGEAGGRPLTLHHGLDELVGLDGLQLPVPDVHAGDVPGHLAVEVGGAGVDGLEAPFCRRGRRRSTPAPR